MSRNTPLQLELMWTNPRAYAFYSNLKRNTEDKRTEEEGGLVIPDYEKDRGVFQIKSPIFGQDVIRPGLPFPGGGENIIKDFIDSPKKFLANTNPIFRAPLEAGFGYKLFTGGPITPEGEKTDATPSRLKYLAKELFAPSSPLIAVLRSIPVVGQKKFMAEYFGIKPDDAEPMVQTANSIWSFFGLPIGKQRDEASIRELKNRWYDLEEYIDDIRDQEKNAREEQQKKQPSGISGVDPFDELLQRGVGTPTP